MEKKHQIMNEQNIGGNLLYGGTKSNCLLMIGNFYKTTNQQGLGRRDNDTQQEVL